MFSRNKVLSVCSAVSLASLSSTAFAGIGGAGSVSFAPTAVSGAAAAAIPTMTDGLLIALGIVLAVVAIRAIKGQAGYQKALGVILFGGGLLISGLGVERSQATQPPVTPISDECTTGGTRALEASVRSDNAFTNSCSVPMTITGYSLDCDSADVVEITPVGTSIDAGVTVGINYCAFD